MLDLHFCAQTFQAFQVQVDGPGADRAASGQRDARVPGPREQRPQHQDGGAHLFDELVRSQGVVELARQDFETISAVFML